MIMPLAREHRDAARLEGEAAARLVLRHPDAPRLWGQARSRPTRLQRLRTRASAVGCNGWRKTAGKYVWCGWPRYVATLLTPPQPGRRARAQLAYFLDVSNVARNALAVPLPGEARARPAHPFLRSSSCCPLSSAPPGARPSFCPPCPAPCNRAAPARVPS
jgi:hypothetical protein